MDIREKLVELVHTIYNDPRMDFRDLWEMNQEADTIAEIMIENDVTVQEWIPASEPPTRKDADKYGRVLAMEMGMMALVNYKGPINYPDRFPYWMPLPQPPKGK